MTLEEMSGQLTEKLTDRGLPEALTTDLLAAIAECGLGLAPVGGGDPAAVVDSVSATVKSIDGVRGALLYTVDCGGGVYVRWVEFRGKDGTVTRVPG